jgi:SAM-dependent methyltransferase
MSAKAAAPLADQLEVLESCRICGASSFRPSLTVDSWQLMQCISCDIVFTSPRYTTKALSELYKSAYYESATDYFQSQVGTPSYDHLNIARQAARNLRVAHPSSIDIGTGAGRQVAAFAAIGFRAKGTEPSDVACAKARSLGLDVVNVDIAALPSRSFDCVTAIHVLEHVPEPLEFMRHIARIVSPGGVVVIEVPNFGSSASRRLGPKWQALYPSTHLFHFTPRTLGDVCGRAGLSVFATHRVGGAGLFSSVAVLDDGSIRDSAASPPGSENVSYAPRSVKQFVWNLRKPLLSIPGVRPLLRWINWEVLGQGEYVRVLARRPA